MAGNLTQLATFAHVNTPASTDKCMGEAVRPAQPDQLLSLRASLPENAVMPENRHE